MMMPKHFTRHKKGRLKFCSQVSDLLDNRALDVYNNVSIVPHATVGRKSCVWLKATILVHSAPPIQLIDNALKNRGVGSDGH